MSRCFGYVRVSTDRQAQEGHSLEAQTAAIKAHALAKGLGEVYIFVEGAEAPAAGVAARGGGKGNRGVGGSTPFADREAGAALVATVRPGDHIVITKLDRGFRNLADFLHWFDAWGMTGVNLHVIDFAGVTVDPRSAMGRLFVTIVAAFAQWEREQLGERIRAVHAHLRSQGLQATVTARVGFRTVKNKNGRGYYSVPDVAYRKITGQIFDWHASGKSGDAIFQHLRAIKAPLPVHQNGPQIKEWTPYVVYKLIRQEREFREAERKGESA